MAAVNVQNRVVQAQAMLPAEVLQFGVSVEKRQPGQLRILALESPDGTYDENFLCNYFYNYLRPAILRIQGGRESGSLGWTIRFANMAQTGCNGSLWHCAE